MKYVPSVLLPPKSNENTLPGEGTHQQAAGKLKRFKRIALRCEKTAQNYASFVALALGFISIKPVDTT